MYTLVKAILREKGINKVWEQVDISNMTIPNIFKKYHSGYIVLSSPLLDHLQYVDLQVLKSTKIPINTQTFTMWLQTLANNKLPATEEEPKFSEGKIGYIDAWQAGYKIVRADPQTGLPNDKRIDTDLTDALLTKESILPSKLSQVLVTVNGFLHRTGVTKAGLVIKDASKTVDISRKNHVGIISFAKLAPMEIIGLKTEQILKVDDETPLYNSAFINLGRDISSKSIIMSLGGFFNAGGIEVINPEKGIIKLQLTTANLHKRLMESIGKIDLKPLGLFMPSNMPRSIPVAQAIDDVTIRKYLLLSQTFFVIIDTPSLSVKRLMLENIPKFGAYESFTEPKLPLITSLGLLPEYNKTLMGDYWVVRCGELWQKDYNYETGSIADMDRLPPPKIPTKGYHKEIGHLLEIKSMQIIA